MTSPPSSSAWTRSATSCAAADDKPVSPAQTIRKVIDEAVLADELGVDFIGVGEHHRADFAISAPEVVLAAIAGRTNRINSARR